MTSRHPEAPAFSRVIRLVLFLGLPLVFWFGFFANLAWVPDTNDARTPVGFIHYDIYRLYYPSLHAYFNQLTHGILPLWDPYRAVGFPSMGSYLFGVFYPLNAPFLFFSVPIALAVTALLHFMLSLWGMFRFLRGFRLAAPAAMMGGLVYTFSGFMAFSLWHPSLFQMLATVPLVFALGDRWARKGGMDRAVLLGIAMGIQGLAGYLQGTVYMLYALVPFLVVRSLSRLPWRVMLRRRVPEGAVAAILAAAVMAVVVLPTAELSRQSIRKPGGLTLEDAHPIGPLSVVEYLTGLLDPVNPYPTEEKPGTNVGVYYFRGFPYVGIAALLLALAAPFTARRRRWSVFFAALAFGSVLLALGSHTPAFRLFHQVVPTGDWFRFPRRFLALTAFSVAILVALSLDGWIVRKATPGTRRLTRAAWLLPGLSALVLGAAGWLWYRMGQIPAPAFARIALLVSAALAGGLVLQRVRHVGWRRAAITLLCLVLAADAFSRNRNTVLHPSSDPAPYAALQAGRDYLKNHAGWDRIYLQRIGGKLRNHLPAKIGLLDGYLTCMDYEALTLERYARYTNLLSRGTTRLQLGFAGNRPIHLSEWTYHNSRLFDYMSTRFLAVETGTHREKELEKLKDKDGTGHLLRRVFTSESMSIFENPHHVPRVRFVTGVRVEHDPERALHALLDPGLDPLKTVVLEAPPPPRSGTSNEVSSVPAMATRSRASLVHYSPNRVEIEVSAPGAGFVVLTDQFYPGWKAQIDGRPAAILRADYLFRAVPVPTGHHRIVMRFQPRSFWQGTAITLAALLAGALVAGFVRLRRRRAKRRASG